MEEKTRGDVRVSELSEGDVILGIIGSQRKPAWCKVIAVFPASADTNKNTHNGLKADHMLTVHPYKKGDKRVGVAYTLVTDCDVNSAGQAFSPISTAFCPPERPTWRDYITLMSAIPKVSNQTGYFLFDTPGYHDNGTARLLHWFDKLQEICRQLLLCARDGQCNSFEVMMETFDHKHQNKGYVDIAEGVFSNMSGDVEKQGRTVTEVVVEHSRNHSVPFIAVGCAIGALLVIAVVIVICGVRLMEKKGKQSKEQFTNDH